MGKGDRTVAGMRMRMQSGIHSYGALKAAGDTQAAFVPQHGSAWNSGNRHSSNIDELAQLSEDRHSCSIGALARFSLDFIQRDNWS